MLRGLLRHIALFNRVCHCKNVDFFCYPSRKLHHTPLKRVMDFGKAVKIIKSIAPTNLAEEWDNVGLLVEPTAPPPLTHVLLTIDLTEAVLDEALEASEEIGLIVSYHPPIFRPLKRLTQSSVKERIIVRAIESRVGVYSPHTSHDSLWGGVNDWLIAAAGEGVVTPLCTKQIPLDTPLNVSVSNASDSDDVKEIMSLCATSNVRITGEDACKTVTCCASEMALAKMLPLLKEKCKDCDVFVSPEHKQATTGPGRIVALSSPCTLDNLIQRVKGHLGLDYIRVARPHCSADVHSVAVCAGSGGAVLRGVKADAYITGELSHHEVLDAVSRGVAVLLCDHSNTERGFLKVFKTTLEERLGSAVKVSISEVDRDPLEIV